MLDSHRQTPRRRWIRMLAVAAATGLFAAACGGSGGGGDGGGGGGGDTGAQFDEPPDEGTPQRGGKVTYGLEAETGGGWCLPGSQLAAGGIQVASAIYDTLVAPASDGQGGVEYVPYLAESVEPNDTFTEWTITLREGITFHNGEPLNADAVKGTLDAFRGENPNISAPLFTFVLEQITAVDVVDDLTVRVTTELPWVAFDAYLWSTGRLGIVAPAQLADPDTCDRNLIGTGPFQIVNCDQEDCGWFINDRFTAERNDDYWREDADGEQLPYLDAIEFRPIPQVAQRVNGLKGGELDLIHTTDGAAIQNLRTDADAGTVNLLESDFAPEVSYTMLNTSKAPFDNQNARLAVAHAVNVEEFLDITQAGLPARAVQPFGDDNIAYNDPADVEFPEFDPEQSQQFLDAYLQETGQAELSFEILTTNDPVNLELAQLAQSQAEAAGMSVTIDQVEQTAIINTALGGDFQAVLWRNHPGGDPDTQRVWWFSTTETGADNFVNFSRIKNEEIDRIFTEGRSETDPDRRAEIYQELPKVFAEQAYNLWGWYTLWAFAAADDVHGIFPPPLPGGEDNVIIASVQPVVGLWRG